MNRYPDVREAQLDVFMEHCSSPEVKKVFLRMMLKFGSMPHAEPALSAFYDRAFAARNYANSYELVSSVCVPATHAV